jgi:hypothetical protein
MGDHAVSSNASAPQTAAAQASDVIRRARAMVMVPSAPPPE